MTKIMKNDAKELVNEIEHALWAADHPALMIDKTIIDLLRRCEVVLRTMSERPDEGVCEYGLDGDRSTWGILASRGGNAWMMKAYGRS